MGEVFRARDSSSGEVVAVKILSGEQRQHARRFEQEIEMLAELRHPGIVRYVSRGVAPSGELFLVMEWLEGQTLRDRLGRGPLTASEAVTLATRVAEALGAAHARKIVHRDLAPSNLFLVGGAIDRVKVLDFGIAQRAGEAALTQGGAIVGTPAYMAPEQARASGVVDARADVFALGCVLFQCLTGALPFDGSTPEVVLAKILFGVAPRVSELWPEVPAALDALVAQMLANEPALRPSDGANLAAALAALGPLAHSVAALRESVAQPGAFISGERRLLAVVMLGSAAQDDGLGEDALRRAAQPYGGRLELLAGGSAVVVFEAVAAHQVATDRAAQAARCALALRGLAPGRALAIAMGRADGGGSLEEGVIDRAARLLSRAPGEPPPITLDEGSAGLLDARFDVIERESRSGPWIELRGERALVQGQRTLLGRPTSCVGRDWELDALTGMFDESVDEGEARAALVTAAAGMGKSRLCAELVSRIRDRHGEVAIWIGRGDALRAGSTLDLLAQALRGALGIHEGEPRAARRDRIRARVAEHVPPGAQRRVAEFLGELVGAPLDDADGGSAQLQSARQDPQLMSEQVRNAWLDFLQAESAARPVLLVLDDLHWGDSGTVRFIDAALRDRATLPWMVLALARPEVHEVFPELWAERPCVQEIRLKELGRKAGERLVRQVLGDSVGSDTVEHLVQQADGNPFYLEELIRAVAEGKAQILPETVLAMVEARLARFPRQARRVLRAASVFGEVCWEGGVVALLGEAMGAAAVVGDYLARLIEQEVLAARPGSRFPGERELAFRHALLREGAYATLTEDDQRLAHRLAGEWLEQRGESNPIVLAGHFARGGEGARAAGYYLRAAEQASHILDHEAALIHADRGLGCAPPLELRIALLGIRCEAAQGLQRGSLDEAAELLRVASRGSIPWAQGMLAYHQGALRAGKIDELMGSIALLRDITPAPGAAGLTSWALLSGIAMLDNLGHVQQGTALEASFGALARARGDQEPFARMYWNVAMCMRAAYAHDDPWAGLQHNDAIRTLFDTIGTETLFLSMQLLRGRSLWYLGALAPAIGVMEGIPAADTAMGIVSSVRRFVLAWLYADRGALEDARAIAAQLSSYGHAHGYRVEEGRGRWVLAEVLRRMGDLDAAERELPTALALAMPLERPGALATLSALRLAQGRTGEALAAAEDAVARYDAMGGCGMFRGTFVRLAHAEALHATGAEAAAKLVIFAARARLDAIAGKIADPTYRTSFLEEVPENARTIALARAWLGS
jgi:eukaryotic-like serine/threonine-protein kinase